MARIVVIDDARDFTDMVTEVLREDGHDVAVCDTGHEALSCVTREHPDLILLDLRFGDNPDAGWEVLDQLRAHPQTACIPVIVSSAAQDALLAREAWLQERGIPTLPKPFDLDDLLGLAQSAVARTRATPRPVDA